MSDDKPASPDQNPYEVAPVMPPSGFRDRDRPPGPVAIFFSVLLGIAVATITFGVTFFFTCLGVSSTNSMNNSGGMAIVLVISGLTTVGAFVFTVWGLLKLVKLFRS